MKMSKQNNILAALMTFLLIFSVAGCGNQDKCGEDFEQQTVSSVDETVTEISDTETEIDESNEEAELGENDVKTDIDGSSGDVGESDADDSSVDIADHELGQNPELQEAQPSGSFDLASVPKYSGKAYTAVNENVPFFTDSDLTATSYESYSELDSMGRCGSCIASIGQDIMPTEKRGSISSVKHTGWQSVSYDGIVDGGSLYNRSHLIGYQLTAENANEKNLITGTRYMNVDEMLPFENMVVDYIKETDNHVLYRVTPIFVYTVTMSSLE